MPSFVFHVQPRHRKFIPLSDPGTTDSLLHRKVFRNGHVFLIAINPLLILENIQLIEATFKSNVIETTISSFAKQTIVNEILLRSICTRYIEMQVCI